MLQEKVLAMLLQDPSRPLSGEAMSRALGVSRAAVWKAIEALRREGYEIWNPRRTGCGRGSWPVPCPAVWWAAG